MSSCGYHSPRFSEDNVWLPPWLQPLQPPAIAENPKDNTRNSSPSCQNCVFIGGPAEQQQNCQNAIVNAGSYCGFRLHLSGDEDTPAASTPIGDNARPFSLHLSSDSATQLSSAQANYNPQILNSSTCKSPLEGFHVHDQAIEINTVSHNQLKAKALQADKLPESCKVARKETNKPPGANGHRRPHMSCGKVDVRKLRDADVDDAVELSIAASEAMIIAEMILPDSSDKLMTAAALEAALCVKEARKQCFLEEPEQLCGFSDNDLDETDWLAKLDEAEMVDVFQDVGVPLTQTACSSQGHNNSNLKQQNSHLSCPPCHADAGVFVTCSSERQNRKWHSEDADSGDNVPDSLANHVSTGRLQNGSTLGCDFVKQTALDETTSCSGTEKIALQMSTHNIDAFVGSLGPLATGQNIYKEGGEIAARRKVGTQKRAKELFEQETSFISESMDNMEGCHSTSRAQSNDIIASSRASFPYKTEGSSEENQGAEVMGPGCQVVCSSLSFMDPLCSMVPCSISCNEGSTSQIPKCKHIEEEEKELMYLKESPSKQVLGGEAGPSSATIAKAEESNLQLMCGKYSSLRPFSTMTPMSNILGVEGTTTHDKLVHHTDSMATHTGDIPLTQGHSPCFRCENAEKLPATSAFVKTKHNNVEVAVCQQERHTPIILNKKIQRVQACNKFLNNNVEGGGLNRFSMIQKSSCFHGSSEHHSREQQIPSEVCPQSTTYLNVGKQDLKRKRVQFLEPKHCIRQTRSNRRMQTLTRSRWSDGRIIDTMELRECTDDKEALFQGLEFLLTGFQNKKEKEVEALIRKSGGYVLSKVPSCPLDKRSKLAEFEYWKHPIVLSPKKASTAKFLYGCAINTWMLNPNWLFDSLQAGVLLPPGKYLIRQRPTVKQSLRLGESFCLENSIGIFDGVGFLIHGKISFCSKFSNVIKHGGGQVFISLQALVQSLKDRSTSKGIILVANEASISRHLSHCGLEHNIKTVPAGWIIGSLFNGKLIPFKKDRCASFRRIRMPSFKQQQAFDMSQEI